MHAKKRGGSLVELAENHIISQYDNKVSHINTVSRRPKRLAQRLIVAAALLLAAVFHNGGAGPAFAVEPSEMLADPKLETRARTLSGEFRCLVCQNESIDESGAQLAHDLRVLIREQVSQGRSDAEIRDFLVARYGQFILLKPRVTRETLLLWLGPAIILLGGAAVIALFARRRGAVPGAALSDDERRRLAELHVDLAEPASVAKDGPLQRPD